MAASSSRTSTSALSSAPNPSFITIEPSTAASPALINNEVEAPLGTTVAAVFDHGCNPFGTPGTPVWLNNVWNAHAVAVDGTENVTSIGNLANSGTVSSSNSCSAPRTCSR